MEEYIDSLIIEKDVTEDYWRIMLRKDNKVLSISYEPNMDIYWNLISGDSNKFVIDKENYEVYSLFLKLYNRIKEGQVFGECGEQDEAIELNDMLINSSAHRSLYDSETGVIEWFCDDDSFQNSNSVRITNKEEEIELEFIRRRLSYNIPIKFRTSGSKYSYFYIPFVDHYNELCKMDDKVHQMNLDEVAYRMKVKL